MRILLTGASGFVGRQLLGRLQREGHQITACVRTPLPQPPLNVRRLITADLTCTQSWEQALIGQEVIVHCAGRAHVMRETEQDALSAYRAVNVQGTLNLAQQAAAAGVKRFIFLSSIKVNGEHSLPDKPFQADDTPAPSDPYGQSKLEAEQGLLQLAQKTGLEVVIIRPVLIYGPGVKGNLPSLMKAIRLGIPLPFARLNNQRSLLSVDNLADLITLCLTHPAAANQVFLASDGEDLSTPQLIQSLAAGMGYSARLFGLPKPCLALACRLPAVGPKVQRLYQSLQIDMEKTHRLLNWTPPISVHTGLHKSAQAFREQTP